MVPREERREAARTSEDERTDAPERAGRSGARQPTLGTREETAEGGRRGRRSSRGPRFPSGVRVVRASRAVRRGSFDRASRSVARAFPTPETVSNRLFRISTGREPEKKRKGEWSRRKAVRSPPMSARHSVQLMMRASRSDRDSVRERARGLENDGLENAATPRAPGAAGGLYPEALGARGRAGIPALAPPPAETMSAISAVQCRFLAGAKVSAARKTVKARAAVVAPAAKLGCVMRETDAMRACDAGARFSRAGDGADRGARRRGRARPRAARGERLADAPSIRIRRSRAPERSRARDRALAMDAPLTSRSPSRPSPLLDEAVEQQGRAPQGRQARRPRGGDQRGRRAPPRGRAG